MTHQYRLPSKLFVTGTGTDIGKTLVSAVLMAGTRGCYWKPIQSGIEETTDTQWIKAVTGLPENHFWPECYRLHQPLSPHAAAALDGVHIDLAAIRLPVSKLSQHLIVEGAGGLMVPLNEHHFMLDVIIQCQLPVLLVAASGLGTINHTLLSLEMLRRHHIEIAGVVLNGPLNPSNRHAIEYYGQTSVVAQIEPLPLVNASVLQRLFIDHFGVCA